MAAGDTELVVVFECAGGKFSIGVDCSSDARQSQTVMCVLRQGENGEPDVMVGELVDWRRPKTALQYGFSDGTYDKSKTIEGKPFALPEGK